MNDMSKQQGIDVPDIQERNTGKRKKRNGNYELWMRHTKNAMFLGNDWHKVRSYETKEIAEKNLKDHIRKWNTISSSFEFEIREKEDT